MKNKNACKKIQRDTKLEIRMSKEEKELFYKFAEDMGINPSRLARNILTSEAEATLGNKLAFRPVIQAYKKYLEVTKQND
jgi:antitoxin component of RelBE/YafQ-DinJ toxin-antitoxin module